MSDTPTRDSSFSGAFRVLQRLKKPAETPNLARLDLQDAREIRLLLRGDSVIDWHRLDFTSEEHVRGLLALNAIDPDDPDDLARLDALREEAVRYIRDTLGLRLDDSLHKELPCLQLPLIASQQGRLQRQACTLLKVMHILYHLHARELLTSLPISDNDLFTLVESSVVRMFDELRQAGVPVVEFSWSRKSRQSLVTKLLVKRETSAARVFDRLRFRLIVRHAEDLAPTLHVMLRRLIPFNYVVPGQTVNSLLSPAMLDPQFPDLAASETNAAAAGPENEFSAQGYRILNFVADLPVRVDDLLAQEDRERLAGRSSVVFVLAEFQILDQDTANTNETGDSAHDSYKHRQHQRVRERLLRGPKHPSGTFKAADQDGK